MKYSLQKRISAFVLAFALVMTTAFNSVGVTTANAAALKCKSLSANKSSVSVVEGSSVKVTVTQKFNKKSKAKISVSSDNKSVATVSKKLGKKAKSAKATLTIKGVAAGTATITVKSTKKTKKTKKITVTVKAKETATTAAPATTQTSADATTGAVATTEVPTSADADKSLKKISLSTSAPTIGNAISVVLDPVDADDVESYTWYADSQVISGEASKTYTVKESDLGKVLYAVVKNKKGVEFTSDKTAAVVKDLSGTFELTDDNGLQADGTALVGDTLSITFGSSMGKINIITWYNNGKVIDQFSKDAGKFTDALKMDTGDSKYKFVDGSVYVIAENVDGTTQKSNEITIKTSATRAKLTDFKIEEDYSKADNINIDTTTTKAVASVTLNKDYLGAFYLVDASKKEIKSETISKTTSSAAIFLGFGTLASYNAIPTVKESDATTVKAVMARTGVKAVRRIMPDNTVQYVFNIDGALTRGTEYKLIFDQNGVDTDSIGNSHNDSLNLSDAVAMPYVKAPTKLEVTDVQTSVATPGWTAQLYCGDEKATFLTKVNAGSGVNEYKAELFSNASNATEKGNSFPALTNATGVYAGLISDSANTKGCKQSNASHSTDRNVYATFTAPAGVFAKDKFTITSAAQKIAGSIVTSVSLAVSTTNNKNIDVTLNNLDANAKVYLLGPKKVTSGEAASTASCNAIRDELVKEFDATKTSTYLACASASENARSVAFADAISKVNNVGGTGVVDGDLYAVIVVANESTKYANGESDPIVVKQTVGKFVLAATDVEVSQDATVTAKDQYGNEYKGLFTTLTNASMDGSFADNRAKSGMMLTMTETGKASFAYDNAKTYAVGDTFTLSTKAGLKFKVVIKTINANKPETITVSVE